MTSDLKTTSKEKSEAVTPHESSDKEKLIFINLGVDLITYGLILLVSWGSFYVFNNLDISLEQAKQINPLFKFPKYSDMLPALYYFIGMVILHEGFRRILAPRMAKHLSPRYQKENDPELIEIYKNKVTTNIYKFAFYLFSSIYGFIVLREYHFFPSALLGNGEFKNIFAKGYPELFYYEMTPHFDFYYNLNLSFALFDMWVLLSNPLQSDFLFMVLHHLATFALIIFSYVSNYSQIGCIIYFSHYLGDVFTYFTRILVHLNLPDLVPVCSTFVLVSVFIYTRLIVYGDVLYQLFCGMASQYPLESFLLLSLSILMVLNVLWIVLITKKLINFLRTGSIEEIYKMKSNKNKSS